MANGTHVEILCWLDDCSRLALSVTAHRRITGAIVVTEFTKTIAEHSIPYSTLTDNGMVFTTRFAGGTGGRNGFEAQLHRHGITQINSTPNHPTTCGKVERFHQTLKKWLTGQPRPTTIAELQTQLDAFTDEYNHRRPHRALPSTPADPKPTQQPASTPTTAYAPTASTKPDPSPCASTAACTTSASADTTTEPAS
ncbi:integrase core domain-containing protein [Mycobacterium sp. 4858]|uniref:integrase core domain-containing protein n=1 Tax=Mycobacterium sp. 4858 TaxID=2057185 RepID=UPI001E2ED3E1|nr:integrase core domain-containing protein [Mycobacterium sp. 4858]